MGPKRRALAALAAVAAGCGGAPPDSTPSWTWALPSGVPPPEVPEANPMSEAKVDLGRRLFFDVRLSGNEEQSCASCHHPERAFTEPRAVSVGSTGEAHPRNAPGLANVAYAATLTWANPLLVTLERQAPIPLFGEHPVELGVVGREAEVLARLEAEPLYRDGFARAFPEDPAPIHFDNVVRALAAFQRTLLSFDSPYDRFVRGETGALGAAARRGMELFFSERLECFHCHGGLLFSDAVAHDGRALAERPFHNTGLYNVDQAGGYPRDNTGVFELTGDPRDMGRFRAPSLRNVEVTGPYMHDGSVPTLEAVIDIYARGGRRIASGPHAGDGAESPLKSPFVSGFELTPEERADLVAFLESLTDRTFLEDPRHRNPWTQGRGGP
jgi:cytochrome c peroxidase